MEENRFYGMMDRYLHELDAMGAVIAITADHGMNGKTDGQGRPNVIYLQDLLDEWLGPGKSRAWFFRHGLSRRGRRPSSGAREDRGHSRDG